MRENILNIEDLSIWYRTYRGYSNVPSDGWRNYF